MRYIYIKTKPDLPHLRPLRAPLPLRPRPRAALEIYLRLAPTICEIACLSSEISESTSEPHNSSSKVLLICALVCAYLPAACYWPTNA